MAMRIEIGMETRKVAGFAAAHLLRPSETPWRMTSIAES